MPRKIVALERSRKRQLEAKPRAESVTPSARAIRVRELAELCGVEQKTIHNWVAKGVLPHFRTPGRHLRFLEHEVRDFVRECRSSAGRGSPRGAASVVVVLLASADVAAGIRALRRVERGLVAPRIVWVGAPQVGVPADVERARSVGELRKVLRGGPLLGARDGHRRDSKRR